jgi:hypothetical protein
MIKTMKLHLFHSTLSRSFMITRLVTAFLLLLASGSYAAVTGTISVEQFHNTSSTASSMVTFQVVLSNGWTQYSGVSSLVLKNDASVNVYTHPGGSSTIPYGTVTNLPSGHYKFTATINTRESDNVTPASVYIEQDIWVGNRILWENCFDMEQGASQYSLRRSAATAGTAYSYAQSFNTFPNGTDGWAEMSKLTANMNDSHIYWILEPISDPRTFSPSNNITYIDFFYTNSSLSGIKLKYKQLNGTYTETTLSTVSTDKIRFTRTSAGACKLFKNSNVSVSLFVFPVNITGDLKITVLGKQVNDQADQIAASYTYPSTNYPLSNVFNSGSNTNTGDLTMRIAPLSGFSAPYNYFVSEVPIGDMKTVYKYLKDTIYPNEPVDSTTFFGGKVAQTNYTSGGLAPGTYYTAAFDSRGVRIFSNVHDVLPATADFQQKVLVENSYNEYVSTGTDAYANMKNYITHQENNARMIYYITNLTDEHAFGFVDENVSIYNTGTGTSYQNLKYGFRVMGGNLHMIVNGASVGSVGAKTQVPIELIFENGKAVFRSEGVEIGSSNLPSTFTYKSAMYFKKWGIRIRITPVLILIRPYNIAVTGAETACSNTTTTLGITLSGFHNAALSNISFTLKNVTDETNVVNIATMTTTTLSQPNLPIGVYSLEGSLTVGGTTYSNIKKLIYVGSRLSWDPYANIVTWPNNGAATHSAVSTPSVNATIKGQAIAANKLPALTPGWMVFTPSMPGAMGNIFTPAVSVSFSESPLMGSAAFDYTMPVVHFIHGMALYSNTGSGQMLVQQVQGFAPNTPVLVARYASGAVKIRQNYSVLSNVSTYTNARWKPAFLSRRANAGITSCLASFQCSSYSNEIFAQLKYELDGYYHVMKNGDIKFVFDQEYDDANLTFNLYNSNDILIRTQAQFPPVSTTHGMNYKTIVVRGSDCIGQGFFYLEVINSKNEKMYLRFYNDYTGCTPSQNQGGEGQ